VDAFAVLKSAQSAQLPMHAELFLLGTPSGSWECHWRLAGKRTGALVCICVWVCVGVCVGDCVLEFVL
jgi:hypothetical protein